MHRPINEDEAKWVAGIVCLPPILLWGKSLKIGSGSGCWKCRRFGLRRPGWQPRTLSVRYWLFFDIQEPEKADEKVPRTVRAKRAINAERVPNGEPAIYIWQDDLKRRISEAALQATDFESFQEELVSRGVELDIKQPTKKHPERVISYELVDTTKFDDTAKIPRNLKCRSYKLGADYEYPRLEEQFLIRHCEIFSVNVGLS